MAGRQPQECLPGCTGRIVHIIKAYTDRHFSISQPFGSFGFGENRSMCGRC